MKGSSTYITKLFTVERRESFAPNRVLLDVPPLAVLTNAYLHGFNELRQCAIITIRPKLAEILMQELQKVVDRIIAQKSIARSARQQDFAYLAEVAARHFIPYIERCFNHIFQSTSSLLDTSQVLDPLSELFQEKHKQPR